MYPCFFGDFGTRKSAFPIVLSATKKADNFNDVAWDGDVADAGTLTIDFETSEVVWVPIGTAPATARTLRVPAEMRNTLIPNIETGPMKTTLFFCLSIRCSSVYVYGANPLPVEASSEKKQMVLPESVRFSESIRELVMAANGGDANGNLQKLHNLDRELSARDPNRLHATFFAALRDVDPKVMGTFEDSLVTRYTKLMAAPDKLSEPDRREVEMIAVVAKEMMSLKLGKLFLRDVTKVEPYLFKENVERSGWRPADVDDWKGLQGRMVAASIASDDLELLKHWIALADASTGNLRLLIWWGLGYSLREEAIDYLLEQHSRELGLREKIIVGYAVNWSAQRMTSLSKRLEKYEDGQFGVLTAAEVKGLRSRLQRLAPGIEQRVKNEGLLRSSAAMMYQE